ncbi:hypothetical protein Kpol_423p14 [Vanderwaltozyma polyspora DSM 70294]|uniref:Sm protein B n=1 Tax=Vanderwaltozyma polyspora (strain ATCC 22028 / DSM 70294 / BCRC 21397 / CBS 2163 / NBRC 10782 / NRRL Y-8283 / UCD 57-17) TaxID=436907 RepID=A7TR91_VANPO|nr:uncharacterized protein Kpol_423p14 [Vanderwaltozyma polyspora DSM 70294]EDO15224.1 hypothetical protein Kpol_423p14 [Vanderwaltozyma polyspora DSM 70294]
MKYNKASVQHDSKLGNLINYRIRVITADGRVYIGQLMAYDKHMNVVLGDCVEERIPKTQLQKLKESTNNVSASDIKVEKRVLGLTILRGEHILSTVVEDKPLLSKRERISNEKKQEKQLQKQKRKRSNKNNGKVQKQTTSTSGTSSMPSATSSTDNRGASLQTRKFQPPPGFKKR